MKNLVIASLLALASATCFAADRASELLALQGTLPVKKAGPYVEVGTFQIQVGVKLGQPTAKLADGTWVYSDYQVEGSDAHGALIVRFSRGRVSQLSLVTPANATAMLTAGKFDPKGLVAANR